MLPVVSVWTSGVCRIIKIVLSAKFVIHFQVTHRNTDAHKHVRVSECIYTYKHHTKGFQNQSINEYPRIELNIQLNQNPYKKNILSQFRRLLTLSPSLCNYDQPSHTQFTGSFKKIALPPKTTLRNS